MSLKSDLLKSPKLSSNLVMQLMQLDDATDPSKPLFSAFVQLDSATPFSTPHVQVNMTAGTIATAHGISLQGLKELVDSPRVKSVQGSTKMRPTSAPRP